MEDKKYSKLRASFEATQPKMPDDFTDRVMKRIKEPVHAVNHRSLWTYAVSSIAAAACIALLIVIHFDKDITGEQPILIAKTDTTQTAVKKVEKQPLQKEKSIEVADSVKIMKEKYRMPRPPKHYMAKTEREPVTAEPELMDATELAQKAFAEEMRRMEMDMMSQMNGNLQTEFQEMTREIRQRGERMNQKVEMALNEDE